MAAAVTAGVPVVVHPQLWDQYWHGRQVTELGVGALARSTRQVSRRVESVLSEGVAARAGRLADDMASEDGVSSMVGAIDRALHPSP